MAARVSCASRMREAMERQDINQSDLSRKTGISKATISQYLSGKYEPSQPRVEEIAKALSVSEAWLMGFENPAEIAAYSDINTAIEYFSLFKKDDTSKVCKEEAEYLSELRNRPEFKKLFRVAHGATKEEIERAIKIIAMLKEDSEKKMELD